MSKLLIQQYLNQLATLKKVSGTTRERVVSEAFKDLLKGWARAFALIFVPEYEIQTKERERRYVDGALLYELRVPFGYWEAKDERDDLNAEIALKFKRGYPQDNIIFEDSREVVLIQHRLEVRRCAANDVVALEKLLNRFFAHDRAEIAQFRRAVEQFKADLPAVLDALREMIEAAHASNANFRSAAQTFLTHAQETINTNLTAADIREMLIQHILTEEIFAAVFPTAFHRDNNVARELYRLEDTFFTGNTKFTSLKGLEPYYAAIRAAAAQIDRHQEKQTFLKVIYENFYKVYNVKAADRLGVVYTPNEIVRFMIESADWLCEKHFGKSLIDRNVEILDPATGTGTFISELLEHFRGQPSKLHHKYREELHANEVAILPYYVANLNIEATYAAIAGNYEEFPNLCFVDTLDNVGLHTAQSGTQADLFGGVTEENVARIKRQNTRRISVVIGNPPYNANQLNENENNKNREYLEIDKRIKETYIKASTAQKTKLYDMYARFFRWASDRLDENGVLALITNRSFIDSRTFDGFRKIVAQEFNEIRIVDLGGDIRINPKLSGSKHNVFGIQTGVAISFMVKKAKAKAKDCKIYYSRRPEFDTAEDKLAFLQNARIGQVQFDEICPDKKNNWINLTDNDYDTLLPVADKATKRAKKPSQGKAIFKLFSLGVVTARDEWVYDHNQKMLEKKVNSLIDAYNADLKKLGVIKNRIKMAEQLDYSIKWTRAVKNDLQKGTSYKFENNKIVNAIYRPFVKKYLYFHPQLNEMQYQLKSMYPILPNLTIAFLCVNSSNPLASLAVNQHFDYCLLKMGNGGTQSLPLWYYTEQGERLDNITDWALVRFTKHYQDKKISKESIFHYVYGVLHDPSYREKYALNLKREFPRVPFRKGFWQWADWGKKLMELHIGYETIGPYKLQKTEAPGKKGVKPECKLKADKDGGRIILDTETALSGIPQEAWDYKLGNRSALEWILDQYKESRPKDPTIREKFNTYRFADYKEHVTDLLLRVTRVSVETMKIVEQMKQGRSSFG